MKVLITDGGPPYESPDTTGDTDSNSSRALIVSPAGTGAPADTYRAMQVVFDFEGTGSNKAVFAYEVLGDYNDTSIIDYNATEAQFDSNTKLSAYIYNSSAYSNYQIRMMVIDGDHELEISDPYSLGTTGWREIEWDLTDATQINSYTTSEPCASSGDGVLDTAGRGALKISPSLVFSFRVQVLSIQEQSSWMKLLMNIKILPVRIM